MHLNIKSESFKMLVVGPKFKLKFTTFQIYALKKSLVANKL